MLNRTLAPAVVIALSALALSGCVGQDDDGGDDPVSKDRTPAEVMELAKETLDETSGLEVELYADEVPDGISGIVLVSASGTAVHPSSFQGSITGSLSGITQDGDVVAIDGDVWIKLPILGPDFQKVDPADYSVPDPGRLFATEDGISDLLVETGGLEKTEEVRGGENNDEVLTEYSGTLTGDQVERVVPTASGEEFQVSYSVTSDGELREVRITGEFYSGSDDMTYVIGLDEYGTEKDIKAP